MTADQHTPQDPRTQHPNSLPADQLEHPGLESDMSRAPDFGELEHMRPGAAIINTASIQAYQPDPMLLAYAATKAAIVNFTRGLAQETIENGVRVNAVAPGPIWTPLIPATMPAEEVDDFGTEESPMGRAGQPAEVAPVYVFLASQAAGYVNGEVIGGMPLS